MQRIINHPVWETHAILIARVLMGGMFLLAGVMKFMNIDGTSAYIESAGLPIPGLLAWLTAIFEVAAGAAIILGKYFKESALALALFTLVVSFALHSPNSWTDEQVNQLLFTKNMAILAGLLFMAAHGAGRTWRLK